MNTYQKRHLAFKEVLSIGDWQVKVYTISKTSAFDHPIFYKNVLAQLPQWLQMKNSFDASNDKIAFLIIHAGTEGIFSLINWWVGSNMLNTHIFITPPDNPISFDKISGDGLFACIWELLIINHESVAWRKHILEPYPKSNYAAYLADTYAAIT